MGVAGGAGVWVPGHLRVNPCITIVDLRKDPWNVLPVL